MCTRDGNGFRKLTRDYTREPAVIAEILEIRGLPRREFWRRTEITDFRAPGCLHLETLVYFLRDFKCEGEDWSAARLTDALTKRVARTVTRRLNCWRTLSRPQREDLEEDILSVLYTEWLSLEPAHEFWEVRAGVCLERAISDEVDRQGSVRKHEVSLTPQEDDDGGSLNPWDSIPDVSEMDADTRAQVMNALDFLGPQLGQTFYLYHYVGMTQAQIAALFEVEERTVRYRLARAEKLLKDWRGTEMD